MRARMTADDLVDVELSYAPQFGSAKDPVNFLGYIADNMMSGAVETIQWHELGESASTLIDVRTPVEFAAGAIPGAINIPLDDLRSRLDEVPAESVVHCQVGLRGYLAARILMQEGKATRNLDGGYKTWSAMQRA
ncbi:carbonate dehydratase [Platysternon megacephalum]|uniref:Carbonate dehydratase n=1 Tax=Platysternon megacephalum TaxID=55544 RepID=A0A4D9DI30_9SAUR|nr:carbonate dehydratase [Platysternon megacephalum]